MMPESKIANRIAGLVSCIVWLGGLGCQRPPVDWQGPAARIAGPREPPVTVASTPREKRQCRVTVRYSANIPGNDSLVYAAWWTVRSDSSAMLRVARSRNAGKHWETAITAEERDRSVMGCSRPAPSIMYDPDSGYLHLAYYLEPPEGSGIFYEHLMQGMFHAPVVIVYGERPVVAAVAAAGDTVVVAYEDPNRRTPQIVLALSYTAGHLFDTRVPASGDDVDARAPVVRIHGGRVEVGWYQTGVGRGDEDSQPIAGAEPVTRQGTLTGGR